MKYRVTTNSSHRYPIVENKLMREFRRLKEIMMLGFRFDLYKNKDKGWLYLTTMIDLLIIKVIGWALSKTMKAKDTVIPAFRMALINRPLNAEQKLIFHSDRGIQYACEEFVNVIGKHKNIEQRSMSRKGDCWDSAVAESFFKTIKVELIYRTNTNQDKKQNFLSSNTLKLGTTEKEGINI